MKALIGLDFVRGPRGTPLEKKPHTWRRWANRKAEKKSKQDGCRWYAVCVHIKHRNAIRISFAGQPEQKRR